MVGRLVGWLVGFLDVDIWATEVHGASRASDVSSRGHPWKTAAQRMCKQETQTSVCPLHQLQGERFGCGRAGDADEDEDEDEHGERGGGGGGAEGQRPEGQRRLGPRIPWSYLLWHRVYPQERSVYLLYGALGMEGWDRDGMYTPEWDAMRCDGWLQTGE